MPLTAHHNGHIELLPQGGDPEKPDPNDAILWICDGTGSLGSIGDVIIASNLSGTTKYTVLHDHSAGITWS